MNKTITAILIAAAAATGSTASAADLPEIYGSMLYNSKWNPSTEIKAGIYAIPTTPGAPFEVKISGPEADFGGVVKDGVYYATRRVSYQEEQWNIVEGYDLETGEKEYSYMPSSNTVLTAGMDIDPLSGEIVGICYTEDLKHYTVNSIEYSRFDGVHTTVLLSLEGNWSAFAIDADGQYYGLRTTWRGESDYAIAVTTELCAIDRETGAVTVIGDTGHPAQYTSAMVCDRKLGRLFYYVSPNYGKPKLTELDKATGAATVIAEYDDEIQMAGLFIPGETAPAGAPAVPTDVKFSFPGVAMQGTVTVKAPETLFDGSAPQGGQVTLHVELNGFEKATQTADYGETVSIPISMGTAGLHTFHVYASNENGNSPKVKVRNVYVGADTPAAPTPSLTYTDGNLCLSWPAVTTGVNGGGVADIKYTVVRYPDLRTVATDLSECTFTEPMTEPEGDIAVYYYGVTAAGGDLESAEAHSNQVVLGYFVPPFLDFSQTTPDYPTMRGYTVVDCNDDGITWKVYQGTATISFNEDEAADDWMILPPLYLRGGQDYDLQFYAYGEQDYLTERVEVKMGTEPTVQGMTLQIVPVTDIKATARDKVHFARPIKPETDGKYYIGFHGCSAADKFELHLTEISLAETDASGIADVSADKTIAPVYARGIVSTAVPCEFSVMDASGRVLMTAAGTEADLTQLHGVLIVSARTADGSASMLKIVR